MSFFGKKEDSENNKMQRPRVVQSSAALLYKEGRAQSKRVDTAAGDQPQTVNEATFSDLYITPDKTCYVWSGKSNNGLKVVKYIDLNEFIDAVVAKYEGISSYSLRYKGTDYRIERSVAIEGEQYCARKMPKSIPELETLGLPRGVYYQLMKLADKSGLILLSGATGAGKSTTISSLLKKYLETEGGYAYTIEDPAEMPLDGIYYTPNGDIGLCKQTVPPKGIWEDGIKSALRSMPRYIYLGEVRSAESAEELLRAATSGHLVFSTIHANNVNDAINAMVKYAASGGMSEAMAYELMANGLLACLHQNLSGTNRELEVEALFANPNVNGGCAVRSMIRSGNLNVATLLEIQRTKLEKGLPLFD
ncbi:Flp pilus assembly complex ATPase component TadA [bacterium]|nr:Flp pilus assembly complex ATPase component TadA [bacterium]MBR2273857.1 Flp pilus assembly complex ATPase component TadA [Alphaproteobacteria bacterium]